MVFPLYSYQTTEGNAKGNGFPAWKRVKQKSRCCWCLSCIFSPTAKVTCGGFLGMSVISSVSVSEFFLYPQSVLSSTSGRLWGLGIEYSRTTLNQKEIWVPRWISQLLHLLEGESWAMFFTFSQRSPASLHHIAYSNNPPFNAPFIGFLLFPLSFSPSFPKLLGIISKTNDFSLNSFLRMLLGKLKVEHSVSLGTNSPLWWSLVSLPSN